MKPITEQAELIRMGVQNGQFPQYLYRFRQLDDNFSGILEHNAMWFSKPDAFNDPFDCKANLDHAYTEVMFTKWIISADVSIDRSQAKSLWGNFRSNPNKLKEIVQRQIESQIEHSYICCFAKEMNNLLLWSHYTNGHSGVCLKFEMTKDPEFFTTPMYVKYSDVYPRNNYLLNQNKAIEDLVTTKSREWEYEEELRVIKYPASQNKFHFKKEALVEIIFGCKTSSTKIQEVKDTCIKWGYTHVSFRKATTDSNEYKLNFEPI